MMQRDLPQVLPIADQATPEGWSQQDFLKVFQSADAAGWVAEAEDRVVGFLIYQVHLHPDANEWDGAAPRGRSDPSARPLRIAVRNFAVAADWRRRGIALALLNRLAQKLRQASDGIQATVPESNLAAQLVLRKAGYKAMRVLRGYYGSEDAYLMERRRG
jgi:ribosomal-protein-alanine N-acetyltransferase